MDRNLILCEHMCYENYDRDNRIVLNHSTKIEQAFKKSHGNNFLALKDNNLYSFDAKGHVSLVELE